MRSVSGACWGTRRWLSWRANPASRRCRPSSCWSPGPDCRCSASTCTSAGARNPFRSAACYVWAVAFRICGLVGGPFYEDDFYRYLWDGYRFATDGTPYGPAPEVFFLDPAVPPALQSVLSGINHPELPTIYSPVTQAIFLLGYWVHPGSVAVLQAILIGLDLALVGLLLRLAPARNVLLYAWCPLVIKEIAFTAHPDGAGACLLLAAVVLSRDRRWQAAAVALGLAAGAKAFGLVLAPLVLAGARLRHWLLFAATVAAVYAPFALRSGSELASLQVFAREWEFNSWLFGLLKTALPPFEARLALGLAFAAFWAWVSCQLPSEPRAGESHGATGSSAGCWRHPQSSTPGTCFGCCHSRRFIRPFGPGRPRWPCC